MDSEDSKSDKQPPKEKLEVKKGERMRSPEVLEMLLKDCSVGKANLAEDVLDDPFQIFQ